MFLQKAKAIFEVWSRIAFLIIGAVFVSCASTGGLNAEFVDDTTKAGAVFSGNTGSVESPISVFIDDKNIGTIGDGETKGFELKNGRYALYITGNYDGKTRRSATLPLVINNDRIKIQVFNMADGMGLMFDSKQPKT
jgi:hypothetical protein